MLQLRSLRHVKIIPYSPSFIFIGLLNQGPNIVPLGISGLNFDPLGGFAVCRRYRPLLFRFSLTTPLLIFQIQPSSSFKPPLVDDHRHIFSYRGQTLFPFNRMQVRISCFYWKIILSNLSPTQYRFSRSIKRESKLFTGATP